MIPVNKAPTITPKIGLVNAVKTFAKSGESASGLIAFVINCIPYIKIAKPTKIEPTLRFLTLFDTIIIQIPTSAKIGEKLSGFKSCKKKLSLSIPAKDKIQAVRVVPMFDPIITPIVCPKSIIPELTKPTSITVKADDD